jgi:PIN domain nuclease of toxin-antitoxin system
MRILLDTHMLLWWMSDDPRMSRSAQAEITLPHTEVYVSAISLAEISVKTSLGKLTVGGDLQGAIDESGFHSLPFTAAHGYRLADLPWHHRDPFDRMLVAQALAESLVVATVDPACRQYTVQTLS